MSWWGSLEESILFHDVFFAKKMFIKFSGHFMLAFWRIFSRLTGDLLHFYRSDRGITLNSLTNGDVGEQEAWLATKTGQEKWRRDMEVSWNIWNRGTPIAGWVILWKILSKWMVWNGGYLQIIYFHRIFFEINHPAIGVSPFMGTSIYQGPDTEHDFFYIFA